MSLKSDRMTEERRAGGRARRALVSLSCGVVLALAPVSALAQDDAEMAKDAGIGFGSAIASLAYVPVKTFYAVGGVLVGGLAYAFSGGDAEVARVVLTPSVLGDYVITPDHLAGRRPVEFFGRAPGERDADYAQTRTEDPDVAAAPEGW